MKKSRDFACFLSCSSFGFCVPLPPPSLWAFGKWDNSFLRFSCGGNSACVLFLASSAGCQHISINHKVSSTLLYQSLNAVFSEVWMQSLFRMLWNWFNVPRCRPDGNLTADCSKSFGDFLSLEPSTEKSRDSACFLCCSSFGFCFFLPPPSLWAFGKRDNSFLRFGGGGNSGAVLFPASSADRRHISINHEVIGTLLIYSVNAVFSEVWMLSLFRMCWNRFNVPKCRTNGNLTADCSKLFRYFQSLEPSAEKSRDLACFLRCSSFGFCVSLPPPSL